MDILSHTDKVKQLLRHRPHLRDDDYKLIANVWHSEIKGTQLDAFGFLQMFSEGKLANPESIRRIRQKLQEEFPELRGEKYKRRHQETEKVKGDLFNTPELYQGGTP